jgi:hypothetical protein
MHGLWDPIGQVSIARNIRFSRLTEKGPWSEFDPPKHVDFSYF